MILMAIKCCKNCVPPQRHPGCHSTCPDYIREKAEWEEEKAKIKAAKENSNLTQFDFDKICYSNGRNRRRR